eukprot:gb/GFBE01038356.1/.p1 GENE.gb/GFBE01038356.1/~~gb/GFBE01038356.1/.p1  ORF type:complete len:1112 (+),score=225.42 gb/GFBE01038356.1/:1-3336(+)
MAEYLEVNWKDDRVVLSFRRCYFTDRQLESKLDDELYRAICSKVRARGTVECCYIDCDISENKLTAAGAAAAVRFLKRLHRSTPPICVRGLRCYKNRLGDEGARHIADLIISQPFPFSDIHLSHNNLTALGASLVVLAVCFSFGRYPFALPGKKTKWGGCWMRLEHNDVTAPDALVTAIQACRLDDAQPLYVEQLGWKDREWGPLRSPSWAVSREVTPQAILYLFADQSGQGKETAHQMRAARKDAEQALQVVSQLRAECGSSPAPERAVSSGFSWVPALPEAKDSWGAKGAPKETDWPKQETATGSITWTPAASWGREDASGKGSAKGAKGKSTSAWNPKFGAADSEWPEPETATGGGSWTSGSWTGEASWGKEEATGKGGAKGSKGKSTSAWHPRTGAAGSDWPEPETATGSRPWTSGSWRGESSWGKEETSDKGGVKGSKGQSAWNPKSGGWHEKESAIGSGAWTSGSWTPEATWGKEEASGKGSAKGSKGKATSAWNRRESGEDPANEEGWPVFGKATGTGTETSTQPEASGKGNAKGSKGKATVAWAPKKVDKDSGEDASPPEEGQQGGGRWGAAKTPASEQTSGDQESATSTETAKTTKTTDDQQAPQEGTPQKERGSLFASALKRANQTSPVGPGPVRQVKLAGISLPQRKDQPADSSASDSATKPSAVKKAEEAPPVGTTPPPKAKTGIVLPQRKVIIDLTDSADDFSKASEDSESKDKKSSSAAKNASTAQPAEQDSSKEQSANRSAKAAAKWKPVWQKKATAPDENEKPPWKDETQSSEDNKDEKPTATPSEAKALDTVQISEDKADAKPAAPKVAEAPASAATEKPAAQEKAHSSEEKKELKSILLKPSEVKAREKEKAALEKAKMSEEKKELQSILKPSEAKEKVQKLADTKEANKNSAKPSEVPATDAKEKHSTEEKAQNSVDKKDVQPTAPKESEARPQDTKATAPTSTGQTSSSVGNETEESKGGEKDTDMTGLLASGWKPVLKEKRPAAEAPRPAGQVNSSAQKASAPKPPNPAADKAPEEVDSSAPKASAPEPPKPAADKALEDSCTFLLGKDDSSDDSDSSQEASHQGGTKRTKKSTNKMKFAQPIVDASRWM